LHIGRLIQLALLEDVSDMAPDHRAVPAEQLGELLLPQPHRLALQPNFDGTGRALVDHDFGHADNSSIIRLIRSVHSLRSASISSSGLAGLKT